MLDVGCRVSGVKKNCKIFIACCERQVVAVYMKKVLGVKC
ncbi:Uncharacterized protein dnm_012780 [Desulfonema magnum]|uniref:Uncharacterized protein n=1 Tax=Desulfonema magnum TaxID=45655 RepID=A0A975GLY0_9BACT|nr:Uncharacterized protein dnm_012780 [Desulfonema magnum]